MLESLRDLLVTEINKHRLHCVQIMQWKVMDLELALKFIIKQHLH